MDGREGEGVCVCSTNMSYNMEISQKWLSGMLLVPETRKKFRKNTKSPGFLPAQRRKIGYFLELEIIKSYQNCNLLTIRLLSISIGLFTSPCKNQPWV
jgi:hypothetical protein